MPADQIEHLLRTRAPISRIHTVLAEPKCSA
jgi:hypothetical protein